MNLEIAEDRRATAAQQSEERFRLSFEDNPMGMALFDADAHLLKVNKAFCNMLGYAEPELTARAFGDITHPEDAHKDARFAEQLFCGAIAVNKLEKRFLNIRGESLWVKLTATVMRDKEGQALYGLAMIENITARKRAEDENRLLLTITKAISESEDLNSALGMAVSKVCEFTSWEYGEAWLPSRNGKVLECSANGCVTSPKLENFRRFSERLVFTKHGGLVGRVWISKKPEWIENVSASPKVFTRAEMARKAGLKTGLGIPIIANEEVVAVLVFLMFEAREEDKHLLELISAVAAQLGFAIQRKRIEAALRESEERYRTLVETSHNAILVEQDEQLVYANPTALRFLGYESFTELEGFGLKDLFEDKAENPLERFQAASDPHAGILPLEGKLMSREGKAIEVDLIVSETTYRGKPAIRVVANDITETKKLRLAAHRMERLAALGQFATVVAHEIRNPLGALSLNFQYLANRLTGSDSHKKTFTNIEQGIARIQNIVKGILDYGRPAPPVFKSTNIHHVLDSSIHAVKHELDEADIHMQKNYGAVQPEVLIDANQLVQVFVNLFLNAKDAMRPGGRLTINTSFGENGLEVQIVDTGKGIAPENLESICNPFFTTKGEGVGLGLAVVSRILEEHHLQMLVASTVGTGTTFTLTFPKETP